MPELGPMTGDSGDFAGRVLVADDAPAARSLVLALLDQLGYDAVAVDSGVAAIQSAIAAPRGFGLALLDIDMPGADGPTAARAIRDLPDPPPLIGLVAAGRPEEADRALAAGMRTVLAKPVRRDGLLGVLDRWYQAPAGAPAPIDFAHLARYTLGDQALERELFDLFRDNAETYLAQMSPGAADEPWHRAAHSLKGAARGLGANAVADLAQDAEALVGGQGDPAARANLTRRLRAAVAILRRAVHPDRLAARKPTP